MGGMMTSVSRSVTAQAAGRGGWHGPGWGEAGRATGCCSGSVGRRGCLAGMCTPPRGRGSMSTGRTHPFGTACVPPAQAHAGPSSQTGGRSRLVCNCSNRGPGAGARRAGPDRLATTAVRGKLGIDQLRLLLRPTCQALGLWQVDVDVADGPHAHRGVLDDAIVQAALGLGDEDFALRPAGSMRGRGWVGGGRGRPAETQHGLPHPQRDMQAAHVRRAAWMARAAGRPFLSRQAPLQQQQQQQ